MFLVLFSFNVFSVLKKLFLFYLKFFLKINSFLAALGLCCFAQAFSSYREWGLRFVVVHGLLIAVVFLQNTESRCAGLGGGDPWAQELWLTNSRAHGHSCSAACGIFPGQGLNPCPLHWQANSLPLSHQGSSCT